VTAVIFFSSAFFVGNPRLYSEHPP